MLSIFNNIFVDTKFDRNNIFPREILYKDVRLYRFMDYFFLKKPVDQLSPKDVVDLCKLRLKFREKVIDYNYNEGIVTFTLNLISENIECNDGIRNILDFGCGTGVNIPILLKRFPNSSFYGYDLSTDFLNEAFKNGLQPIYNLNTVIIKFDLVVSFFVFHFNITKKDIDTIFEKMRKDSLLVFNIYGKTINNKMNLLTNRGFKLIKIVPFPENEKHFIAIFKK